MTSASRSTQFAKVLKVLKKYYKPVTPVAERPVLEHLLFACCLEDARYETAEEVFAALVHTFFDWNEIRVTSISELSEVMAALPDPRAAANRIKRVLHGIFEENYSFDLEDKRKKNLGPTVKWLEEIDGTSRFSVAYVVQSALGGHSIPIDAGTMGVLRVLDLVTDQDVLDGVVPGLERAIAKSKGVEFGSLLHQIGADFSANPFSSQVRAILLEIDPAAKDRFPQRRAPKEPQPAEAEPAPPAAPEPREEAAPARTAERKKKAAARAVGETPPPAVEPQKPRVAAKKAPPAAAETPAPEKADKKHHAPAPAESHKVPADSHKARAESHEDADTLKAEAGKKKSPMEGLAKRKPR
jgi:endonuclease III